MNVYTPIKKQAIKKQKGMSLLEVLIAALILGIALVSIAVMQMNALKTSGNSSKRSIAADIAGALAGRMRANIPGVLGPDGDPNDGAYESDPNNRTATDNAYLVAWTGGCGTPPLACAKTVAGVGDDCTAAGMAMWDIYEATCAQTIGLNDLLPNAELSVACSYSIARNAAIPLKADNCKITIRWSDSGLVDLGGDVIGDGKETLVFNVIPGTQKINKDPVIGI